MATDWNSLTWCQRAALLTNAYYDAVASGGRKMIRYRGPNGEREVQNNAVNMAELKSLMQEAQAKCEAANGSTAPRRFAIRAGAMRTEIEPK